MAQAKVKYRDESGPAETTKTFPSLAEAQSFAAAAVRDGFRVDAAGIGPEKHYPAEAVVVVEVT